MLVEELWCIHEARNVHNLYTVGVVNVKKGTVVYFPKKISLPAIYFEENGETFYAQSLTDSSIPLTCLKVFLKYPSKVDAGNNVDSEHVWVSAQQEYFTHGR